MAPVSTTYRDAGQLVAVVDLHHRPKPGQRPLASVERLLVAHDPALQPHQAIVAVAGISEHPHLAVVPLAPGEQASDPVDVALKLDDGGMEEAAEGGVRLDH